MTGFLVRRKQIIKSCACSFYFDLRPGCSALPYSQMIPCTKFVDVRNVARRCITKFVLWRLTSRYWRPYVVPGIVKCSSMPRRIISYLNWRRLWSVVAIPFRLHFSYSAISSMDMGGGVNIGEFRLSCDYAGSVVCSCWSHFFVGRVRSLPLPRDQLHDSIRVFIDDNLYVVAQKPSDY